MHLATLYDCDSFANVHNLPLSHNHLTLICPLYNSVSGSAPGVIGETPWTKEDSHWADTHRLTWNKTQYLHISSDDHCSRRTASSTTYYTMIHLMCLLQCRHFLTGCHGHQALIYYPKLMTIPTHIRKWLQNRKRRSISIAQVSLA